jgi:hypothetical protein
VSHAHAGIQSWTQQRNTVKQRREVVSSTDRVVRTVEIHNEERAEAAAKEQANRNKNFVQFSRDAIEPFIGLMAESPAAAQILLLMALHMSLGNIAGVPGRPVCTALGISRATFSRAIKLLKENWWIERASEFGASAYKVNARVFWTTGLTYKGAPGVFKAPLAAVQGADGLPGYGLKAAMVPVITQKQRKSKRRKDSE